MSLQCYLVIIYKDNLLHLNNDALIQQEIGLRFPTIFVFRFDGCTNHSLNCPVHYRLVYLQSVAQLIVCAALVPQVQGQTTPLPYV